MLGKTLLIGITYVDAEGTVEDRAQFAGEVISVEPLVTIRCDGDEPFTLPPEREAFGIAAPGEYRLRATGAVVVDPDFITFWTVRAPAP